MKNKIFQLLLIFTFSLFFSFSFAQNVGIGLLSPSAKLHIKGSADISQLIIDAHSTQGNLNPLIKLRKSDGTDLMWIHSDHTDNTFIGLNSGRVNDAAGGAIYNTFLGSRAGYWNSTGELNTAGGTLALYNNETGNYNTAFGSQALSYNETGNDNTAIGHRALIYNSKGNGNTAIGSDALYSQSFYPAYNFHSNNVAVGYRSLYFNEPTSEINGIQNTAVGTYSLTTNITGANNTAIGYYADVISANLTNATAIGYNAKVAASNTLVLGGTGTDAVKVGIGTTAPNSSSVLELSSTTKGLLPPRMQASQRDLIGSPAEGLLIWCNNCGVYGQIQVYNGSIWTNISGGITAGIPVVGEMDGGGIVAYIFQPGDPGYVAGETHGLIATPSNQNQDIPGAWGCFGTNITGADGLALGTGNQNTIDIVIGCATAGIAARICNDLVLGGYSDWCLPSKDELNKLYSNRVAIGGFNTFFYWSSSEISNNLAWMQDFGNGLQSQVSKTNTNLIRAIRAF